MVEGNGASFRGSAAIGPLLMGIPHGKFMKNFLAFLQLIDKFPANFKNHRNLLIYPVLMKEKINWFNFFRVLHVYNDSPKIGSTGDCS